MVGVPCIQDTLRSGKPLARTSHPVYSRIMEGLVISGEVEDKVLIRSNIPPFLINFQVKLKNYVLYMNGVWVDEVSPGTQYFVTNEAGSLHYTVNTSSIHLILVLIISAVGS